MKDELFDELVESIREGGRVLRGESAPARATVLEEPNVRDIRAQFGLSQAKFATMLGISARTLQNWEQGRRHPRGPARVLLQVAARYPRAVLDTIRDRDDRTTAALDVAYARESGELDPAMRAAQAETLLREEWSAD